MTHGFAHFNYGSSRSIARFNPVHDDLGSRRHRQDRPPHRDRLARDVAPRLARHRLRLERPLHLGAACSTASTPPTSPTTPTSPSRARPRPSARSPRWPPARRQAARAAERAAASPRPSAPSRRWPPRAPSGPSCAAPGSRRTSPRTSSPTRCCERGRRCPPTTTPEPFVDAEDIADVAVAALTQDGHHGQVYELTGPARPALRRGGGGDRRRVRSRRCASPRSRWRTSSPPRPRSWPSSSASSSANCSTAATPSRRTACSARSAAPRATSASSPAAPPRPGPGRQPQGERFIFRRLSRRPRVRLRAGRGAWRAPCRRGTGGLGGHSRVRRHAEVVAPARRSTARPSRAEQRVWKIVASRRFGGNSSLTRPAGSKNAKCACAGPGPATEGASDPLTTTSTASISKREKAARGEARVARRPSGRAPAPAARRRLVDDAVRRAHALGVGERGPPQR